MQSHKPEPRSSTAIRRIAIRRIAVVLLAAALCSAWPALAEADDETAIKAVIERAYVQGVWVQRDPDLVREGFAPTFVMQVYRKGEFSSRTLDEWLDRMKLDKVPRDKAVKAEISVVSHEGDAAVARVEVHLDGKHAYTDFFGLYRADDWRIVSKHYQSHR